MNKWTKLLICAAVLLALCLPMSQAVLAEDIDPGKEASLTLVYQFDGVAFENLPIRIFRVADVSGDYEFSLAGDFAQYPVQLYNVTSQAEWQLICQTLEAYIWADGLTPAAEASTDAAGAVKFEGLTPGLYLTMPITHLSETATTEFDGFLTVIPAPQDDGSLNYDVTAYPKGAQFTPTDGDSRPLRIIKQWKDAGYEEYRPESILVDIYREGVYVTTVTLSAANNWSYSWITEDDGAVWTAVEREIPEEYTLTIETKDDTIILTNVRAGDDPPPPGGDTAVLWPFILGACLSGSVLILLVLLRKKVRK